jgi:hypothetical protein
MSDDRKIINILKNVMLKLSKPFKKSKFNKTTGLYEVKIKGSKITMDIQFQIKENGLGDYTLQWGTK